MHRKKLSLVGIICWLAVPLQQQYVAAVAHTLWLAGGGQRHGVAAAGRTVDAAAVAAVVLASCRSEALRALLARAHLFIALPLRVYQRRD